MPLYRNALTPSRRQQGALGIFQLLGLGLLLLFVLIVLIAVVRGLFD